MKKKLVYKSKFGDIPVLVRDYVPSGEVWFMNGELPVDIFDEKTVKLRQVSLDTSYSLRYNPKGGEWV